MGSVFQLQVKGNKSGRGKIWNLVISRMEHGMELGYKLLEAGLMNLDNHHHFIYTYICKFDLSVINALSIYILYIVYIVNLAWMEYMLLIYIESSKFNHSLSWFYIFWTQFLHFMNKIKFKNSFYDFKAWIKLMFSPNSNISKST